MHGAGLAGMIDGALRMEEYGTLVTSTLGISTLSPPPPPPPPPPTYQNIQFQN